MVVMKKNKLNTGIACWLYNFWQLTSQYTHNGYLAPLVRKYSRPRIYGGNLMDLRGLDGSSTALQNDFEFLHQLNHVKNIPKYPPVLGKLG